MPDNPALAAHFYLKRQIMKQIRKIGSYLITIYDANDKEVREVVSGFGLLETKKLAEAEVKAGESFTIAKIIENSKYSKWGVK